jgi:transposase
MSNSKVQPMSRIALGIDMSKADFTFTLLGQLADSKVVIGSGKYLNTTKGLENTYQQCKKLLKTDDLSCVVVTMEATGVYHENARQFFYDAGMPVIEVLPNKSKAFSKVLNLKTKNDAVDAKMLAMYGLTMTDERPWKPFSSSYVSLKSITRHRQALTVAQTRLKNKHHATKSSYKPSQFVLDSEIAEIDHLTKSIEDIDKELKRIVGENLEVKVLYDRLQTIPGIGPTTALVLLAETNGFKGFTSRRQLVSYAGFDVVERTSGTSVKSEHHISKRGNARIRRILYNGAGHFIKQDNAAQRLYSRLSVNGDALGRVPVMRKMLTIAYALVKTGKDFDPALRHIGSKLVNIETGEVIVSERQNMEPVLNAEKANIENTVPQSSPDDLGEKVTPTLEEGTEEEVISPKSTDEQAGKTIASVNKESLIEPKPQIKTETLTEAVTKEDG